MAHVSRRKWIAIVFTAALCGCAAPKPDITGKKDVIVEGDPRFNVFELSNSAGDGTFASLEGTVYLSFATGEPRYCRAARFPADNTAVLACRIDSGWQIEATSELAPSSKRGTLNSGGVAQAINDAVFALNPRSEFLDEREIVEAANKGWR